MTEETTGGYAATGSAADLGAPPTSGTAANKAGAEAPDTLGVYAGVRAGELEATAAGDTPPGIAAILNRLDRLESAGRMEWGSAGRNVRKDALAFALQSGSRDFSNPTNIVKMAAAFETYLRDGKGAEPEPAALPPNFMKMARLASPALLDVLIVIMAERLRQIERGYDDAHDDALADGQIAYQAAEAIGSITGALIYPPKDAAEEWSGKGPWINPAQHPRKVLLQGVALAVAEMERINREQTRASLAVFSADPPSIERTTTVATGGASVTTTEAADAPAGPVDAIEAGEVRTRAPDTPTDAPAHGLSSDDFVRMAHALGTPTHPLNQTYRNRYIVNGDGDVGKRLSALSDMWGSEPFMDGGDGARVYWVKPAGREALADYMKRFPGVIRDTKDNSKERPYSASPRPGDEPDYEAPRDPEPATDEAAMEASAVPAKDGDQPKAKRTRKRRK